MNHATQDLSITSAAVTDRGLNEKRPLNEDAFLADSARGLFAVADGVGGAEAGEVASQTAIEVLDEAFRHQTEGADIEDLMELAIQRANASIHQMAQDHAKFSMMATTIVGLHIKGNIATIGHVGDSRLYRLTPEGQLLRETEDHSVVQEEVRAGRMTPDQAANHPSKNVISRAIGAETGVEVDMKVIEVDDGTEFLLCSDGITRHIPDNELRQLLIANNDLATVCAELKQRCHERGAEDNLTAVLVCVGTPISAAERSGDLEKTISPETMRVPAVAPANYVQEAQNTGDSGTGRRADPADAFIPASRKGFVATSSAPAVAQGPRYTNALENRLEIAGHEQSKGGFVKTIERIFIFLLLLAALGGAFYGGRKYKGPIPYLDNGNASIAEVSPSAAVAPRVDDPMIKFEKARREVDNNPTAWLSIPLKNELVRQGIQSPLDSTDPQFLYLYGRASLLSGNIEEAMRAFEASIAKGDLNLSQTGSTVRKEATLGLAAVALKSDKDRAAAQTRFDEMMRNTAAPSPAGSPPGAPLSSPLTSP
ncbi:MAG: protein phosphatase 2C domain-containing protein [Acidobacteriota bacterium]|nr:protein phosphatase 2C domain-containing protein [Acidobacteriota bacterium]